MSAPPLTSLPVPRRDIWVTLSLVTVYLVWGSTYYAIVLALQGFPPWVMAGTRHLTAGVLMLVFLKSRGAEWPSRRQWLNCLLLGVLFQSMGNGLVVLASHDVDSSMAALLVATMPLWAALIGGFLGGGWPGGLEWMGLMLGLLGVGIMQLDKASAPKPFGVLLLLLAAASWGLGTQLSRRINVPKGMMTAAAQMVGGGLVLIIMGAASGEFSHVNPTTTAWLSWVYLTLAGSLLGFSAFQYLLASASRSVATSYAYVNPLVAMVLGVQLNHESMPLTRFLGGASILLGVVLMVWPRKKPA